jgi:hypothetical protein
MFTVFLCPLMHLLVTPKTIQRGGKKESRKTKTKLATNIAK